MRPCLHGGGTAPKRALPPSTDPLKEKWKPKKVPQKTGKAKKQ